MCWLFRLDVIREYFDCNYTERLQRFDDEFEGETKEVNLIFIVLFVVKGAQRTLL